MQYISVKNIKCLIWVAFLLKFLDHGQFLVQGRRTVGNFKLFNFIRPYYKKNTRYKIKMLKVKMYLNYKKYKD